MKQNWLLGVILVLAAARLAALDTPPAVAQHRDREPAPKSESKAEKDHKHKKDEKHAVHHEPNALEHTMDSKEFHLFTSISPHGIPLPPGITKFMVLEVIAALLVLAVYIPLARRMQSGEPPRGAWDNFFEVLLTFVREQVAKPSIGEHADRYVPFLWTMFLFVLFNNLLGMVPFMGSATASIYATAGLALIVFFAIHGSAIMKMAREDPHGHGHEDHGDGGHGHNDHGHGGHDHAPGGHHDHHHGHAVAPAGIGLYLTGARRYIGTLWPSIDLPNPFGLVIKLLVFLIEVVGVLVRNMVLAVRLFANMFAGHMVLATILIFIYAAREVHPVLWGAITLSSVFGILALSLLEIFVAFLQAYIFTFLTALFMGMALNPQH